VSATHDDYAVEPVWGLPEELPDGERILWQGAPNWWGLAKDVFHVRMIAGYFVLLMLWRYGVHVAENGHASGALLSAISLLPFVGAGLGLLSLLSILSARTSVYTITNRRVVMRIGVALPTTFNFPFAAIQSVDLAVRAGGRGDIPLSLMGPDRVPYLALWPHVRPWRLRSPSPMLRSIPNVQQVGGLLSSSLSAAPSIVPVVKSQQSTHRRPKIMVAGDGPTKGSTMTAGLLT